MACPLSLLLLRCCAELTPSESLVAKSGYHLLAPTPRALMREMATDRPDTTESPYTVDAGHVQVELDFVSAERDEGSTKTLLGATNLKLGVTSFADVQLIVEPFAHQDGVTGLGDTTLRAKLNVWGDDDGATAFALMPYVRLPTAEPGIGAGRTEAGLILPLVVQTAIDVDVATMIELDYTYRGDRYGSDLVLTASAGRDLVAPLAGYLELVSTTPLESRGDVELGLNAGLILELSEDWQLDAGGRGGLTRAAPDLALFAGGSARF